MHPLAVNLLSASSVVSTFGVIGVLVVLFAETGLLVGFFLPGDSLLFVAGFAASGRGIVVGSHSYHLPLGWLMLAAAVGAVVGAQTGYAIGRRFGPPLFERPDSRLFRRSYVERAQEVFDEFGPGKAVVLARFVPIVRTFLNPLAGTVRMPLRDFAVWNLIGGVAWTVVVILLGYYLHHVAFIRRHLELLILAVVALSLIPIVVEAMRHRRSATSTGS